MKNILETVVVFIGRTVYMLLLTPFLHGIHGVEWWTAAVLSVFAMTVLTLLRRLSAAGLELVRRQREIVAEVREMRRECTRMSIDIKEINETMQYQWEERKTN